jgi:hypothetical protein
MAKAVKVREGMECARQGAGGVRHDPGQRTDEARPRKGNPRAADEAKRRMRTEIKRRARGDGRKTRPDGCATKSAGYSGPELPGLSRPARGEIDRGDIPH